LCVHGPVIGPFTVPSPVCHRSVHGPFTVRSRSVHGPFTVRSRSVGVRDKWILVRQALDFPAIWPRGSGCEFGHPFDQSGTR
jgi:hypothetical protein